MSIRASTGKRFEIFSAGLDNSSALDSPEIKGSVSVAKNTDFISSDLAAKRNGYVSQFTWGTRRIRGGYEYRSFNGTIERLLYGEDATPTGFSGTLGKQNGTGTPTTITSNLADNVKPCFAQFRSLVFLFNGRENLIYVNGATRAIGITPPNNAPTFNSNISGSLNASGSYLYCYAYYNTTTGARSSPSPASAAMTTTASLAGIKINVTAGDSNTADKIQIYRSIDGGSTFFREAQIAISSTTYESTVADLDLTTEMETDDSQLPEAGKFAVVGDNRVFVAGFSSNPNRIHYSKIGIDGSMPESYQAADFIDCNINDGDQIVGLGMLGDTPIVLKEFSVGRLVRTQTSQQGLERTGFPKYVYEQISTEVSGVSHHSILSNDNLCIWLGRDDVYATDGVKIYRMGWRILESIQAINFNQSHKFSAINKKDSKQLIFSVARLGASEPDYQLVGDYKYGMVSEGRGMLRWSTYEPGSNTSTHPGLQAASLFEVTINKQRYIWFGSSSNTGKVFQMDLGTSDNSLGIYWDLRLPFDGYGSPNQEKMFHSYYILAANAGVTPNNVLNITWEENDSDISVETDSYTFTDSSAVWNTPTWNNFNWATAAFEPFTYHPHKKAYFGRFGVNNTYADQPIAIKAISAVAQISPLHR